MENFPPTNNLGTLSIKPKIKKVYLYFALFLFVIIFLYFTVSAPRDFPKGVIFNIEQGSSLRQVSLDLKNQNFIKSRALFEIFAILYGGDKHIISADYLFEDKISVLEVARRISRGERHLAPVKLTIPEGFNVSDIAELSSSKFTYVNKELFLEKARAYEGYLFPDTYFFFTTATSEDIIKSLNDNFIKKVSILDKDIIKSGKKKEDIIKMASIIERESKGDTDRDMISGILWKRISINMPLQADAAPETYQKLGLPKKPIANPGLPAIRAAIYPKSSPYLYYLHDKNGVIHYARNFSEHRQNIVKYLK